MAVSCQTVVTLIEKYAPKKIAEEWDNIGLQIGNPSKSVSCIFLTLDLNGEILEEARDAGADMLVVHHTPFFKPVKNLRDDLPGGKLLCNVIRYGMALYTAHTNLDAAEGGVNDALVAKLGLQKILPLSESWQEKLYKLAVYVPNDFVEVVSKEICKVGAGCIGNYSDCTFKTKGMGTFVPLENTNPFVGNKGELERVEETKLETIVSEEKLAKVIRAMIKAHPYEEVAYDVFPLVNDGKKLGIGRIGILSEPLVLKEFVELVKEKLNISIVKCCGKLEKKIKKVAVCGGSGASYIPKAVFMGADVLLTADIKYHEAQKALEQGLALVDGGHYFTEQPIIAVLAEYLKSELGKKDVTVVTSQINSDPFNYM
ncbi:MAG: Nif3-like dinuclear metal center hexameric protein [Clostridia bacterium]|nr:Nif3-like dinuclear metal center hexameric protein [Clostridia bacterium]MDD4047662.1 Nif3-like dinuclear metal center hexameric protein [Clostridia bacterium]